MKKLIALLLLPIMISGCAAEVQSALEYAQSEIEAEASALADASEPKEDDPLVYEPEHSMTIEETVAAFFEQQYLSYTQLVDIDLSAIIDMRSTTNQNMVRWTKMLTQRRKLLLENDFCYVGTEEFPYTISFEENAEDDRMQVWEKSLTELEATIIHFRIEGEAGEAYPPMMALNSQHSMMFRQVDGVWKIAMHYFPGSRRKYSTGKVMLPDEDAMQADLALEFEPTEEAEEQPEIPEGTREYDAEAAVRYAIRYTEMQNPAFNHIGDWIGNCANFVSQSVWTGFGADKMTVEWHDGSAAWNHVGYFWNYITSEQELGGEVIESVSELRNGDIIQTRPVSMVDEPDRFTHELIVVDEETLKLAQNTPAAFVYYSDLVNVETRMIRPTYLR